MEVSVVINNIFIDVEEPRRIEVTAGELLGGAQKRLCLSEGHWWLWLVWVGLLCRTKVRKLYENN